MLQHTSTLELVIGLVLLLPLISFLLSIIIPERYGWLVSIIASALLLASTVMSLFLFFSAPAKTFIEYTWFEIDHYSLNLSFQVDSLSLLMIVVVTVISFLVHVYSTGYMAGDSGIKRYFAMLGFFTFAMLGIVLAGNLIVIFFFWELVGFSSYTLIGHWMEKPAAAKAAQKAFLFNRIGDAGFLIGIMIIWANTQTLNVNNIVFVSDSFPWQTAAGICIFFGVIGKSAQLPLFSWLPDAMEGPAPVSALIHAATMVAAGVFLLIRIFPLFTETTFIIIAITGTITSVFAAMCALHQFDIKKILAYSTISQLGLMITAIGVGAKDAALLHLFTHAFFKAGLFLAAGSLIHVLHSHEHVNVQDIRNLGGLRKKLPFIFSAFCITGASLAGIPLLSGFLSKDSIITSAWLSTGDSFSWRWIILVSIITVSFLTVLYTFRMIWFMFFGKETTVIASIGELPWVMKFPVLMLTITSGWFLVSTNPVKNTGWFEVQFPALEHSNFITALSAVLVLLALIIAWFIYVKKRTATASYFIQNAFGFDVIYEKLFGRFILKLSTLAEAVDRKWIDGALHFTAYSQVSIAHGVAWFDKYFVDGITRITAWLAGVLGSFTRSFQGGKIQLYIFWAVAGLIIFLFFALI